MKSKPKKKQKSGGKKPVSRAGRISPASDDAETNYPLSEWMVPATDSHGHSAKVFTRVPPAYKSLIGSILQSKRYPWETESDLVRVAVHRLLNEVAKDLKRPDITSQQALLNSLVEMASREMEYNHFKETLEKLNQTVSELIANGAQPMAKKMIRAVAEQVEKFEETYWRERYETELVSRFKTIMKEK